MKTEKIICSQTGKEISGYDGLVNIELKHLKNIQNPYDNLIFCKLINKSGDQNPLKKRGETEKPYE